MNLLYSVLIAAIITLAMISTSFGQTTGSVSGQVVDTLGASVVGATVYVVSAEGKEKTTTSNQRGEFSVSGIAPGKYTVRVTAEKFALYENTEVEITAGGKQDLTVALTVEGVEAEVDVSNNEGVSTDPQNNAGATVLKGDDLNALPDDPDDLEAALQALAGPSAGPNGGQIYIDGFTGGQLPPKESIREIRINSNPFSAEYDRLGFGRIEILTKPGSDKWRGSLNANFNDESLNSRNPFASNKAPSQMRSFGGNISGPVQKGKSSFFLDVNNRDNDSNAVVNARILDPSLNIIPFEQEYQVPTRRFSIAPRFDYQINDMNTLVARYGFNRGTSENQGIGNTSLPSRAYNSSNLGHEIRLTETMILNPTTINETRFQYEYDRRNQDGDNSIPTISVADAFSGGGAQIGHSFNVRKAFELQNYTTTTLGKNSDHGVKFGVVIRNSHITDRSESGFGGSFSFTNLDNYINAIGDTAIPTQFTITTGNPQQSVSRTDYALFATDDWRISPKLTLSFGLRYENQTNISDNLNFAPRVAFAWSPEAGGSKTPKTVIRGGFGMFYDRFNENLTLQALRFDGFEQTNLVVSSFDPNSVRQAAAVALLGQSVFSYNGVTNVPTAAQILEALPQSNTIRTISDELKSPTTYQYAIGVERQLPAKTVVAAFFIGSRINNMLRSRNINAPICPAQIDCGDSLRPVGDAGNIYQIESTGRTTQNQFIINFRSSFSPMVTLFGNYRLGYSNGDTDGSGSFPSYSYDLSDEYGRSSFDIRHNFVIGGAFNGPWGISLSPFVIANSGRPFNITSGVDTNGDALFTERPTFAQLGAACTLNNITNSFCDVSGHDPNAILPRNYGSGSGSVTVNLRAGKNFGFGGGAQQAVTATSGNQGGGVPAAGGRGGRGGGGGGGGMGGFGGGERKPYNLNIGISFNNLLNTVNLGNPIGNISSSRFGQSISTGGGFGGFGGGGGSANRRIDLSARFSW